MAQTSADMNRGVGSRLGWPLKIFVGALLVLLVLVALNAFALNNETKTASLTVPGAKLVTTSSGQLQVLDTGPPPSLARREAAISRMGRKAGPVASLNLTAGLLDTRTPIVLVHGSAGAINWWDELIPLLKSVHRVIAIDMLGYGGSDKPDSDYSVETQAALVAEVLARLEVSGAVLVGHSLGGKVVTSVAEQAPELASGLVIIDTGPDNSQGGLSGSARAARTPLLGQALWRLSPDFMVRRNLAQGFAPGFEVPDKFVDDVRAMTYSSFTESAKRSEEYLDARTLPERLNAIGKPLLVIFGEEDQIFEARDSLSAFAAIPGVKTQLILNSGHSPQVEAPAQTAKSILGFSSSIALSKATEAVRTGAREKARARARARSRNRSNQKSGTGSQSGKGKQQGSGQQGSGNRTGSGNGNTGNGGTKQQSGGVSAKSKTESRQGWKATPAG